MLLLLLWLVSALCVTDSVEQNSTDTLTPCAWHCLLTFALAFGIVAPSMGVTVVTDCFLLFCCCMVRCCYMWLC